MYTLHPEVSDFTAAENVGHTTNAHPVGHISLYCQIRIPKRGVPRVSSMFCLTIKAWLIMHWNSCSLNASAPVPLSSWRAVFPQ